MSIRGVSPLKCQEDSKIRGHDGRDTHGQGLSGIALRCLGEEGTKPKAKLGDGLLVKNLVAKHP
ncbi:MAG: hypothetical protein HZA50_19720 [Planctomycetes bacterium]|nr:hypothetical protein [Planctomycetota bacterium]